MNDCDPIITVGDLWDYQKMNLAKPPAKLTDNKPAIPCGLVAKSMFNDTFTLKDSSGKEVTIEKTNIAWSSDIQYKFSNINKDLPSGQTW